jgi:hypothetical protein
LGASADHPSNLDWATTIEFLCLAEGERRATARAIRNSP